MSPMTKEKASRKYIDLIRRECSKYANWQPSKRIEVGDHGKINHDTGELEIEGNVYRDSLFADVLPGLCSVPTSHEPMHRYVVTAKSVKGYSSRIEPGVDVLTFGAASIKGEWEFGNKRGALLMMYRPRISSMSNQLIQALSKTTELKEKSLVTETFCCPAYSMYLSTQHNDKLRLELRGMIPTGTTVVTAGGGVAMEWWSDYGGGMYQDACNSQGEYSYVPLYHVKKIRRPPILFRESPEPEPVKPLDPWINQPAPWDILDEEGSEFEDIVSD